MSSANHTIAATFVDTQCPAVTVTAPNGGEDALHQRRGQPHLDGADNVAVTCVDLLLSRNGVAGPYETIATCVANTGHLQLGRHGAGATLRIFKVVAHDAAGNAART